MFLPPYHAIFSSLPVSACVISASNDPIFLDVNEAFVGTIGRARDDLVGKRIFDVFPESPDPMAGNEMRALRGMLERVVATGSEQSLVLHRYPIRARVGDGQLADAERFWDATCTPIFDGDGKLACILHVAVEVTEQKRAEEASRRCRQQALEAARHAEAEEAGLDAVLQAAPVGIMMADAEGRVLHVNPEHGRLWGRSEPLATGIAQFDRWKGWWADGSARQGHAVQPGEWPLARALRGEETSHELIEIEGCEAPHGRHIVLCNGAPIRSAEGNVTAGVVALMDVTERLEAEAALREADRRKDEFLAMLAHELRNPLAPIVAAANLLGHGILDGDRVRQASTIISRQVRHMTGLVDDLLDVSRVTRGLIVLDEARLDVKRIVFEAIEQVLPLIESRHHELTVHTPPEQVAVCGDSKRLVQVLANLLSNAAKYTPDGGRILLDTKFEADKVHISVIDNGIGMGPDLIEHAFDLFSQAERGADRSQGGLGIGLALVRSLVELHGGRVSAHSRGRGHGSRFTVSLPRAGALAEPAPEPEAARSEGAGQGLQVLVVDDNQDAASMLALMLQALGNRVTVEHNPFAALDTAKQLRPDACILDIGLPDMDGNELARRLRADPASAGATLIAVTGYGRDEDRMRAFAAGFDHHFVKPVSAADLSSVLAEAAHAHGRDFGEPAAARA